MKRHAFTLVELLVVIAVIGMIVGMLIPAIHSVRGSARRVQCQSNLRQIGLAMEDYLLAHGTNGKYPDAAQVPSVTPDRPPLYKVLAAHIEDNRAVFHCPADDTYFAAEGISYEYPAFRFAGKTRQQALVSLFGKKKRSSHDVWLMYDYESFHGAKGQEGARNVLFADGHVQPF